MLAVCSWLVKGKAVFSVTRLLSAWSVLITSGPFCIGQSSEPSCTVQLHEWEQMLAEALSLWAEALGLGHECLALNLAREFSREIGEG